MTAVAAIATFGLLAFVTHALVEDAGSVAEFFDRRVYYFVLAFAVVLCGSRAILVREQRGGWTAITLAVTAWGAADLYYLLAVPESYPSLADALYLAFYPLAYVGLALLFRSRVKGAGAGIWLDGLAAGLATASLGAAVILEVVLDSTEGGTNAAVATNLAYPLGDITLVALVVGAFAVTRWSPGRVWLVLGVALAVNAIADSVYLWQVANDTYVEGTWVDSLWPAAMLLLGLAAWAPQPSTRPMSIAGRPLLVIPIVAVAVATGVLIVDHWHAVNIVAIVLASSTMVVVLVRLGLTMRENRRLLEQHRRDAITDPVTGLANRRRLVEDLDEVLADDSEEPWLLAIFDLDGFKTYNDTFGHLAGDALLHALGGELADAVPTGRAYRLGGDEFCVLVEAPDGTAAKVIDDACAALEAAGEGFSVGSSFGAVFLPADADDPRGALRIADERLYAQKHGKRFERDRPHEALLQALYEREPGLQGHVEEVVHLAGLLGESLGLSDDELREVRQAAQLHDIGLLAIPETISSKPAPLDDGEWEFVRRHTIIGQRILAASPALARVGRIVRATHERWDGTGYPDGLVGEEIPLAARIVHVCDAYDAITADRPYDPARPRSAALAELERCAGTQFDPDVVRALRNVLLDLTPHTRSHL